LNRQQIENFVMRYLEATDCHVVEKAEGHVTVKFSPEADKDLMNRSYYWNFVERTGAEPEPMSFSFIFDPEKSPLAQKKPVAPVGVPTVPVPAPPAPAGGPAQPQAGAPSAPGQPAPDSILGRYFGFVPTGAVSRIPNDVMVFGSRRLDQLFSVVQTKGRFVRLFEEQRSEPNPYASHAYSTWLCVNFKVEFTCDMKREEIHSLGINMSTGTIVEHFYPSAKRKKLTPKLPNNIHLQPAPLAVTQAVDTLETYLLNKVKRYDHRWANEALRRLSEEFERIDAYYEELLANIEPDKRAEVEEQYKNREQEIDWQYRPRVVVSVINCGFFHFAEGIRSPIDATR